MTDDKGWTAYIASNFQFQFDNPPQAGALTTSGFSVCPETGYVAIGGSTRFYRCVSGTFSNIYDRHWAPQCREIRMLALPCGEGAGEVGSGSTNVVGTTMVATTIVTVLADGQLQVVTTVVPVAMCQIGDGKPSRHFEAFTLKLLTTHSSSGQVQAHTTPCAELVPSTTYAPVSELEDGQVPAPSGTLPVPSGVVPPPPPAASTTKPPVAPAPSADTSSTLPPTTPPASTTTLTVSADASGLAATASRASFFALTAGVLSLFAWL